RPPAVRGRSARAPPGRRDRDLASASLLSSWPGPGPAPTWSKRARSRHPRRHHHRWHLHPAAAGHAGRASGEAVLAGRGREPVPPAGAVRTDRSWPLRALRTRRRVRPPRADRGQRPSPPRPYDQLSRPTPRSYFLLRLRLRLRFAGWTVRPLGLAACFGGGLAGAGFTIVACDPPSPNSSLVTSACWPTRTTLEPTK